MLLTIYSDVWIQGCVRQQTHLKTMRLSFFTAAKLTLQTLDQDKTKVDFGLCACDLTFSRKDCFKKAGLRRNKVSEH